MLMTLAALSLRPVPGPVVTDYRPPAQTWSAGHRGVDLLALEGDNVAAAADGVVAFTGSVAGRPVLVISHGQTRTTYEPVVATVSAGQQVRGGQKVGVVLAGHPGCPTPTCLHLGLKQGEAYLDPTILLHEATRVRLVPADWRPPPVPDLTNQDAPASDGPHPGPGTPPGHGEGTAPPIPFAGSAGPLVRPPGPITSRFGPRLHPVLGIMALHDGIDLGLPCGSTIPAVGPGLVVEAGWRRGTGWTVVVDHGGGLRSLYGHASSLAVRDGMEVRQGQRLGAVGSTGYSTGCHLHLGIFRGGRPINPLGVLT